MDIASGFVALTDNLSEGTASRSEPTSTTRNSAALCIKGKLRLGPMKQCRDSWTTLENPDLNLLLTTKQTTDCIVEAVGDAEISVVDADTHHWSVPPKAQELCAYLGAVYPAADVCWISHGNGMKFVYIGPYHRERALAASFSIPQSFEIELLQHTRHPNSARSDKPDSACSSVTFNKTDPQSRFDFRSIGIASPQCREDALNNLGMKIRERYPHKFCPIDPSSSAALDCVVALEGGIYCHRCAGHGIQYRRGLSSGFVPYTAIAGTELTAFQRLATNRVHWVHAVIELNHFYPNISPALLKEAYRKTLFAHYSDGDPRIANIFDEHLGFVRGETLWLSAKSFEPTKMDTDAASAMPYVQYVVVSRKGPEIRADKARRSEVKFREPHGYTPVRPYRGIYFDESDECIPVLAGPKPKHKIELLAEPMSEADALGIVEKAFPHIDFVYLKGCIAAAICAETGRGQPPMLCATGPSGSGKGETIRLAASFLGEDAVKVQLLDDAEKFMRSVGALLTEGRRFLVFDEFGKIRNLASKISSILQLGATVSWRPLFLNNQVNTVCRAAFFFPCVRFNDFLTTSAEFIRRTRRIHLHRKTPNWSLTCGGDTAAWRDSSETNARAANSILTHCWRLCHDASFRFL